MFNTLAGLSRFKQGGCLAQSRIEEIMEESIAKSSKVDLQRGLVPVSLDCDLSQPRATTSHPITCCLHEAQSCLETPRSPVTPMSPATPGSFSTTSVSWSSLSSPVFDQEPSCAAKNALQYNILPVSSLTSKSSASNAGSAL